MTGEAKYIHGLRGVPDGATVVHHAADGSIVATIEVPCGGLLAEPVMLLPGEGLSVGNDDGVMFLRYGRPLALPPTPAVVPLQTAVRRAVLDGLPVNVAYSCGAGELRHLTEPWPWWAWVPWVAGLMASGLCGSAYARARAKRRAGL